MLPTYDWGTGKYMENGQEVDWQQVEWEFKKWGGFEEYMAPQIKEISNAIDKGYSLSFDGNRISYVTTNTDLESSNGVGENYHEINIKQSAGQGEVGSINPLDGIGQIIGNGSTIAFGGSGIGIQALRQLDNGNGPKLIGRALGFGTQRTATALSETLEIVNKLGKYTGYAGQALNTYMYLNKALDPNARLTTGDHVGFWTGTAVWGASLVFASNPIVLGAAVVYGAAELGSWNGKSIEQNIFDK